MYSSLLYGANESFNLKTYVPPESPLYVTEPVKLVYVGNVPGRMFSIVYGGTPPLGVKIIIPPFGSSQAPVNEKEYTKSSLGVDGDGVGVFVAVGVLVGVLVFVGVGVGVFVFVDVCVGVIVFVGVNVFVFVGVGVGVFAFVDVCVGVIVFVGVNVFVFVGVSVGVSVFVGVGVGVSVFVTVGVLVFVGVGGGVGVAAEQHFPSEKVLENEQGLV